MGHPVTIDEEMLVSAVRYALGRANYIVMSTTDAVRSAWPGMSRSARAVILRDIQERLKDAKDAHKNVGMDMDHRQWLRLHRDIITGALTSPPASAETVEEDEDWGPGHGYPSEDELDRLAAFRGTPRELMEYAESIWRNGAGVTTERRTTTWGREEVAVSFVTGGWSGCESVIGVLKSTLARMYSSRWERGGLHEFAFPAAVYDSDKPWDWALLAGDPDTTAGPYQELRDRLAALEATTHGADL